MKEEDLSEVMAIEKMSYPNPWPEPSFRGEMGNRPFSNAYVIVERSKRKIIGYVLFWKVEEEAQITNIAVHPDYRRRGIARYMLNDILRQIHDQGANYVILEVRPSNLAARMLYNKLGFKVLGIRKKYYRLPEEDALIMGKRLSQ